MKLELKHLAPYLPYGTLFFNGDLYKWIYKTDSICRCEDNYVSASIETIICYGYKPILRPLSDIVPYFYKLFIDGELGEYLDSEFLEKHSIYELEELENIKVENLPYGTFQLLVKYHFDVYDLIQNGLAIDINTLNK